MAPLYNQEDTLLDLFLSIARNPDTVEDPVLECGSERWTYGDLDSISSGLAIQMNEKYGLRPTIAVISENHPYVLAILLAIWKLDGVYAPMDPHAPMDMIQRMLENVAPMCVVAPEGNQELTDVLQNSNQRTMFFPKHTTVISLTQRFLDLDPTIFPMAVAKPSSSSLAAYIHTSSASSLSNLKHVQLTHGAISNGSQLTVDNFHKAWPSVSFIKPKVLGFSPWSHVMAISHDIGSAVFALGGSIIMGVLPAYYPCDHETDQHDYDSQTTPIPRSIFGKTEQEMDILDRLLETALRSHPDIFAAVPWVLEGFQERYQRLLLLNMEDEAGRVKAMLQNFKCFGVGGAAMAKSLLSWAVDMRINLSRNIGMTEFGGPIFHTRIDHSSDDNEGWPMEDCLVRGAVLTLVNDAGEEDEHEGELIVRSKYISHGYLKYDNSAFTHSTDGTITFRTGDIYAINERGRYIWKGRRDDYIQMASSETLDPRPIERALNLCSGVAHCCVVGNNFISRPSHVVCVIIEPSSPKLSSKELAEITRTIASINRTLLPPLRIAWSRVGILNDGMTIPYTRKGTIFRKKLEAQFGDFLGSLLHNSSGKVNGRLNHGAMDESLKVIDGNPLPSQSTVQSDKNSFATSLNSASKRWNQQGVQKSVIKIVADVLEIEIDVLRNSPGVSFSEFGMDSNMAVRIVNELNGIFGLQFPLNACHDFVDVQQLSEATVIALGIKEGSTPTPTKKPVSPGEKEEVVIVGQAVRLPGDINTAESFWDALIAKRDDIMIPIPADRWDHPSFYRSPTSTSPPNICDITFEKSGFVQVTHFDNNFFGISTPEALNVSPSTRLTLETVFDALEDACIPVSKLKGTNTGVFVAASLDEGYNQILYAEKGFDVYTRFYGTGVSASTICGRISYLLDIHGPSSVTDTACSSGLVVLDQAVKFIQSGEGDSAIVSAVNTNLWCVYPFFFTSILSHQPSEGLGRLGMLSIIFQSEDPMNVSTRFLSAQKMASPNSRCATFTNEADGYVPSEASVSFILKSKRAAIRDRNNILAVIKSTDVMHGGKTQGLVAPNVNTQISLQRSLLSRAGLEPSQIDFLETHGTGTQLGDLIEIQGINTVFENSHSQNPLILGAAKSCIGHTEVAAGLVGLLKAIGTLNHSVVPGLVHLTADNMNPSIKCGIVPISIPIDATPLPPKEKQNKKPYHGLVLANGFAGTFAGVIIEEYPDARTQDESVSPAKDRIPLPFVISAKSVRALEDYLEKYLLFCRNAQPSDFRDICYTACVGREHYRYRFACVASDMDELIFCLQERLRTFSQKSISSGTANRVAFVFPGQGSQYQGMASELAELYSDFKEILVSNGSAAVEQSGFPILSFLLDKTPPPHLDINDSQTSQICIFIYQYSVSIWLKALGVEPCAVLGHSLGEIAASAIAGAMSFEDALAFVIKRADLLRSSPTEPGAMAIISASKDRILQLIFKLGLNGRVVIAVYNDPESHVVSGEFSAVETLLSNAKDLGMRGAKLNVTQGFHSPLIYPRLPVLQKWLTESQVSFSPLNIPFLSTVYGSEIPLDSRLTAGYWVDHARDPVRLWDAVTALSSNKGIDAILDIGPQPFIWAATQTMSMTKASIPLSSKRQNDQGKAFLSAISALFENGVGPTFERLFSKGFGKTIQLPTYPYQRQRHYPSIVPCRNITSSLPNISRKTPVKQSVAFNVDQEMYELLIDHRIEGQRVAPGASFVDFFAAKAESRSVKSIIFHSPLVIESPRMEVSGEIDATGKFFLKAESSTQQVCSGVLSSRPTALPKMSKDERLPELIQSQKDVYDSIKTVYLGPSFRNIQNIHSWPTHADVLITVKSTQYPMLDRIRKIDCCLHALGGLIHREVPQGHDLNGSFLPTSLDDFTYHCDDLPESFICRYRLPFDLARNYHVASVSLDVFSLSGHPLISCRKYSVAWIPSGVAVQNSATKVPEQHSRPQQWLRQVWTSQDVSFANTLDNGAYENLLHISPYAHDSPLLPLLKESNVATKTISFFLPDVLNASLLDGANTQTVPVNTQIENTIQSLKGTRTVIVLDLTSIDARPVTEAYLHLYRPVLYFMKLLSHRKLDIANFVIVSEKSIPAQIDGSLLANESQVPTLGALVQGMFRVFRREMALDSQLWALDLPRLDTMEASTVCNILVQEINSRGRKPDGLNRTVAYRDRGNGALERLVPVLREVASVDMTRTVRGPTVVVGMGSIGLALGESLISKGASHVVFIGRRPVEAPEVSDVITQLDLQIEDRISYLQADVCDLNSLRKCFVDIQTRHGDIENVIHTAAVISDAILWNIDTESFENVLRPKVIGAWNLHLITEELCPSLKSFVLLSSISVSLGNHGQMAYVAANSYMEVLSSYRLARKMPATALQLGPWESKLTQNLNVSNALVSIMSNQIGIPLILNSISRRDAVQVIVNFNLDNLAITPAYSQDPLFEYLLPSGATPSPEKRALKETEISYILEHILRTVLELKSSENLDLSESLIACGVDSIAFAQIRGRVMKELEVEVPMMFLSDSLTIREMIAHVVDASHT